MGDRHCRSKGAKVLTSAVAAMAQPVNIQDLEVLVDKEVVDQILKYVNEGKFDKYEAEEFARNLDSRVYGTFINAQKERTFIYDERAMKIILSDWYKKCAEEYEKEQAIRELLSALRGAGKKKLALDIQKMSGKKNLSGAVANKPTEATFPIHNWDIVDRSNTNPGAQATVDDQGNTVLCTSFAMAKAVVDGFDQGKWTNGEKFDVEPSQAEIAEVRMAHIHKEQRVWPAQFNNQSIYNLKVKNKTEEKYQKAKITFNTQSCMPINPTMAPFMPGNDIIPFIAVIVVEMSVITSGQENELHSVYAKSYNPKTRTFDCLNSWGDTAHAFPRPQIHDSNVILVELISATVEIPGHYIK